MVILDEILSISIKQLRELNFFNSTGYMEQEVILMSNHGPFITEPNYFNIGVSTQDGSEGITFEYCCGPEEFEYKIPLVRGADPMGIGGRWLFVPDNGSPCTKLYFVDGIFRGRKWIDDGVYANQIKSRIKRATHSKIKSTIKINKIVEQGRRPYFKFSYRKEFTKPQKKIIAAINKFDALWPEVAEMKEYRHSYGKF